MHIRPAETPSGSGRTNDPGTTRKLRLGGGASRVPVHGQPKATDSPLRVLVSAIGQSLGSRTPLRNQSSGVSSAAKSNISFQSAAKTSANSASTPLDSRNSMSSSSGGRMNTNHSSTPRMTPAANSSRMPTTPLPSRIPTTPNPSRIPMTPNPSRLLATAPTPSRRSSLSSSTSSTSSIPTRKQTNCFTPSKKSTATPSSKVSRKPDPITPANRKSFVPPQTPKCQNNPTTPSSKFPCIPLPTPRRQSCSPGTKLTYTPGQTRSKSIYPTTPLSKSTTANPSTPVNNENTFNSPCSSQISNPAPCSTPNSSFLPSTPLQLRDHNLPESSRRLHFGINLANMAELENMGNKTPLPYTPTVADSTYSFDKNRLAQIKARRSSAQLLNSPAQRIKLPDYGVQSSRTPSRTLQRLEEDRSARFDEDKLAKCFNKTPGKRRVANSLF